MELTKMTSISKHSGALPTLSVELKFGTFHLAQGFAHDMKVAVTKLTAAYVQLNMSQQPLKYVTKAVEFLY